jgi:heparan-alpha-glucosaminide N-acetyltransferase
VVALIEAFTTKVRPTTVRSGPYAIFDAYRWQWYTIFILPHSLTNAVTARLSFFSVDSENDEHSWPFLETNRLGGFIAFVIYIVTTFSLYVPDWSFVYHNDGDVNDGKQFTVYLATFPGHSVITEICRI